MFTCLICCSLILLLIEESKCNNQATFFANLIHWPVFLSADNSGNFVTPFVLIVEASMHHSYYLSAHYEVFYR